MIIPIKRIDQSLPLPEYHTNGAVGFDLIAREAVTIPAQSIGLVPNNIVVKIPEGYMLLLANRSSTALKKGLMFANGVGIIDQDYSGDRDEIKTLFYNYTQSDVHIERGERLSQAIFVQVGKATWNEVQFMSEESRGGFGTTDK